MLRTCGTIIMIIEEEQYEMVGEHTGKIYKLGQKVRVRVQ